MQKLSVLELSINTATGYSLNLPPGKTCPGATMGPNGCAMACYAKKGRMAMNGALVQNRNMAKLEANGPAFDLLMPARVPTIRLYGSGDMATVEAVHETFNFCLRHEDKAFYLYTRSFSQLRQVLSSRAIPENLTILLSIDPVNIAEGLKLAKAFDLPCAFMGEVEDYKKKDRPIVARAIPCLKLEKPHLFPLSKKAHEAPCVRCGLCWKASHAKARKVKGIRFRKH